MVFLVILKTNFRRGSLIPIASRMESMPSGLPSLSITGRCLTPPLIILSTAVTMLSFGVAMREVFDMMLVAGTSLPIRDFVAAKSMSLSVMIPASIPSVSTTIRLPMFSSHIIVPASSMVALSEMVEGGTFMKSLTLVASVEDAFFGKMGVRRALPHITLSPFGITLIQNPALSSARTVEIDYVPNSKLIIHEILEQTNDAFLEDIVRQSAGPQGYMVPTVNWVDGIAFVVAPMSGTEDVVKENLAGRLHYAAVVFTRMDYRGNAEVKVGAQSFPLRFRKADNPTFVKLAAYLKNFKQQAGK